jgi:prepilin-type processing-associated H-X9-DG protein
MNHYELAMTLGETTPPGRLIKESSVQIPSSSAMFADAGPVARRTMRLDPDQWVDDPSRDDARVAYFRVPSDWNYLEGDGLSVPRHLNRLNVGFVDGHAEMIKNSEMGYDKPRTSRAAIWARDHYGNEPPASPW